MTEHAPLNDEERADLTAYLDGELDDDAARTIEAQLNLDPRWRSEAEAMRTAWEMLDYLPRPEASPTFTHRTLQMASASRLTREKAPPRWKPFAVAASWAAGVLLAALVGFGGTRALLSKYPTDDDLVRDLHIIDNHRRYQPVDDLEFLHKLSHPDLFGDENSDS